MPKTIKRLSPCQKAYLAGMIDGEGSICITKRNSRQLSRRGYCFRPVLHVASTNANVLKTLKSWTGLGMVNQFDDARENRKARHQWMVWSNQAEQVVRAVYPWLIIKRRQAKLFLSFTKLIRSCGSPGRRGISNRKWEQQINHYQKMKGLNQ